MINWIKDITENYREKIAWRLFPEFGFYVEAIKRMGAIEENERCIAELEKADSTCSEWAQEVIAIKYVSLEDILRRLKDEGFEEQPF